MVNTMKPSPTKPLSRCRTHDLTASRRAAGFTLIELLVVLAIIASLLTLSVPRYFGSLAKASETVLAENLRLLRETLDRFYGDTGQYPDSLEQLVEKKYLRELPVDPITESTQTWILIAPEAGIKGKVYNVRSSAPGSNRDGKRFGDL